MLGFHPISAFAISELDPADSNAVLAGIAAFADDVLVQLVWAVEIQPFQPGVDVVVGDEDVWIEVSWIQMDLPQ